MLGLPLMIGELMLGRSTGKSILSAAAILDGSQKKKFIWIGRFSVLMSFAQDNTGYQIECVCLAPSFLALKGIL